MRVWAAYHVSFIVLRKISFVKASDSFWRLRISAKAEKHPNQAPIECQYFCESQDDQPPRLISEVIAPMSQIPSNGCAIESEQKQ